MYRKMSGFMFHFVPSRTGFVKEKYNLTIKLKLKYMKKGRNIRFSNTNK